MKPLAIALIALFCVLQYKLWFGENSVVRIWHLRKGIAAQAQENRAIQHRNAMLEAEVKDLKNGQEAIEERARNELGMVKKNEQYYAVVASPK